MWNRLIDAVKDEQVQSPFDDARPPRWARPRWDVVAAVFVGGSVGGSARYGLTSAWPTPPGRFPWATFGVNLTGAFLVAVVLVVVSGRFSARYALPLLGTGFCGAFTTFSAVVVTTAELLAHDHRGTAITYLVASICGGLAAAWLGLMFGRAVVTRHRRFRDEGNGR